MQYGRRLKFAPVGDAGLCTIVFRRFVGQALLTLRLLGEAPFGDSVRRMDVAFGGIVPLCGMGTLSLPFASALHPPHFPSECEKTTSEVNPTTSEIEKTTSEINPTTSEVVTLHPPTSSPTRARITRIHYTIIPRFLPSLPSPPTEKHLTTA